MKDRRWDVDERGSGIASGEPFAPGVRDLLAHMGQPDWLAEDADAHLLPHLDGAASGPLRILSSRTDEDGVFVVELSWEGDPLRHDDLRRALFTLAGSVAEGATAIVQRTEPDALVFEMTTGMLDDQTDFRSHGHLLRFVVQRPGDELAEQPLRLASDVLSSLEPLRERVPGRGGGGPPRRTGRRASGVDPDGGLRLEKNELRELLGASGVWRLGEPPGACG
jgi:hypothetical protein